MTGLRVLLGGGIGSGKSAAGACFERLGAVVLSTDAVARDLLGPGTPQTAAVLARWPHVEDPPGTIDRRALGDIVFGDAAQLAELEAITHPGVRAAIDAAVERQVDETVVVELALLRDLPGHGWPWVVVDAPDDLRVERTVGRGVLSADQVRDVMARQATRGEWLAAAEWVIDNSGDLDHLRDQCRRVWEAMGAVAHRRR